MSSFEGENTQKPYNVLGYKIDLNFHDYKLAIEIDKNGHNDGNIDYEIKRQKAIRQDFGWKFFRIDLDKELSMKYLDTLNNQLKNSTH